MPNYRQKHALSNVQIFNFLTILASWQLPVKHDVTKNTQFHRPWCSSPDTPGPEPPSAGRRSGDASIRLFGAVTLRIT